MRAAGHSAFPIRACQMTPVSDACNTNHRGAQAAFPFCSHWPGTPATRDKGPWRHTHRQHQGGQAGSEGGGAALFPMQMAPGWPGASDFNIPAPLLSH